MNYSQKRGALLEQGYPSVDSHLSRNLKGGNKWSFEMHQKPNGIPQKKAKYFGESSPHDLRDLERNAAKATQCQLAKAASFLEQAFTGVKTAWFGGWALNLRGSLRETHDLSLLILAKDTPEIRSILEQYKWYDLAANR